MGRRSIFQHVHQKNGPFQHLQTFPKSHQISFADFVMPRISEHQQTIIRFLAKTIVNFF